jgi:gluconolactonase
LVRPVIEPGRCSIDRFADGLDHPEGLAFTSDGFLWAGGEAGQIYRIDADGRWSVVGATGGSCLGLAADREDAIYICDPVRGAVLRRRPDGSIDVFADRVGGRALSSPNFPAFGSDGTLYVSCSGTWGEADGWIAAFYPGGDAEIVVADLDLANGLAIDRTGEHLYVAETRGDRVRRLRIRPRASAIEPFIDDIDRLPDGLAFDDEGGLYVACYASDRIYRQSPDGNLGVVADDRESIALAHPTNCAFGGKAFDELFVACHALRHISRISVRQRGQQLYGGIGSPTPA